jgi:bifunctional DNA-binding transcriptional regulator/antitoxin component of YhaV-PrlF toxin-antitoxin module
MEKTDIQKVKMVNGSLYTLVPKHIRDELNIKEDDTIKVKYSKQEDC